MTGPLADWIIDGVVLCPAACGLYLDFHGTPDELQKFISAHDCARGIAETKHEDAL